MTFTLAGIAIGLALTLIAVLGGPGAFFGGLVLAALGAVIGLQCDGVIDLRKILEGQGRAR